MCAATINRENLHQLGTDVWVVDSNAEMAKKREMLSLALRTDKMLELKKVPWIPGEITIEAVSSDCDWLPVLWEDITRNDVRWGDFQCEEHNRVLWQNTDKKRRNKEHYKDVIGLIENMFEECKLILKELTEKGKTVPAGRDSDELF